MCLLVIKMKTIRWSSWWWRMVVVYVTFFILVLTMIDPVISDPQISLLNEECSQYTSSDPNFFTNYNETFDELRAKLSQNNTHFAVADRTNLYALVQCRNYLTRADCLACYDDAFSRMSRKCPGYEGAHVVYQGCYLRYGVPNFNNLATLPDNSGVCTNQTVRDNQTPFNGAVETVLKELIAITPKVNGFFVATSREVVSGGGTVYAIGQCGELLSPSGCATCLTLAYNNIRNCPPLTGGSSIDVGCFLRYSDSSFFPENYQMTDITQYLKKGGSSNKTSIIVGAAGGIGVTLLLSALFIWYTLRKQEAGKAGDILGLTSLKGAVVYKYKDLKSATSNFSEEYKIGEGGFGDVYKGVIKNGDIVAVKKLAITTTRGKAEFDGEVKLINNLHHRNIIRLLGRSSKGPDLLLVYEYMSNGSLDRFLYGEKRGTLNWKQRVDIIFGIARGLAYLHDQFHLRIIHRDIKSSNILLDDDFQPKIADFGLARLIGADQSHLSTRFAGTLGYTAPEYRIHGHLSEKVDTYSFGVVVLEIVSGRRCDGMNTEHVTDSLLEYAWKLYETNMHAKLVDETLDPKEYDVDNVKKIIELALMCTQSPLSLRPTMSEVVVLLTSDRSTEQRALSRPTLIQSNNRNVDDNLSSSTPSSASNTNATVTATDVVGR